MWRPPRRFGRPRTGPPSRRPCCAGRSRGCRARYWSPCSRSPGSPARPRRSWCRRCPSEARRSRWW
ncbi:MAG: hypothetical protein E6J29_01070 [Chloroflexi bacterium]|nr:MAG: hypothetical protein E6J29_01070 [Chloroflexota bacterium]TMD55588.1 MAG: hypothetical protein E6I85_02845 [Chloroflexota bacterium]